jgi:hypothetical protein
VLADGIEHEQEQHGESSKKKRKRYQISDDEDEAELTNGEQELEQMLELNEDETESVNAEGSLDESEVEEQSGQIELVEITLDKYYAIKYEIDSKRKMIRTYILTTLQKSVLQIMTAHATLSF